MISALSREWRFMLRQPYVLLLLACSFLVSGFSVVTGLNEVASQHQVIERLKAADTIDRAEAQAKYDDPGSLAYYSFHLTYSEPTSLSFAALGQRDVYPWKHRIRMLALEGQIYESDAQNAELAQAGKIDFTFVISALAPLFVILLFHDLIASERSSGRHDLLISTSQSVFQLWGARAIVRFVAIALCLIAPFYIGAWRSGTPLWDAVLVTFWCIIYFGFWALLSVYFGRKVASAPRIASSLIGIWALFAFVIPVLGDLIIEHSTHSPKGADILLTQREAVNDAWDLPVEETMNAFFVTHPEYKGYSKFAEGFAWEWYYAFQQVGDQVAQSLSQEYRAATFKKYDTAAYVSLISPPMLFQRAMNRRANTDTLAALEYESQIRQFHKSLRMFYYPWLFIEGAYDKTQLSELPQFDKNTKANKAKG